MMMDQHSVTILQIDQLARSGTTIGQVLEVSTPRSTSDTAAMRQRDRRML